MSRVGAFFDMDKTLIDENSGSLFMKQRYAHGEISGLEMAQGLFAYLRYKVGLLDVDAWTRELAREIEGLSVADLERTTRQRIGAELLRHLYPAARALVETHRGRGHLPAIITGAANFVAQPLAEHLHIEHILCTRFEERGGRFSGLVQEPPCVGKGKIHWLNALVAEHDIDLARSYFYTDSITDLPLLEIVGNPVVVNPDHRLYREAVRRRWPVRLFEPARAATR